MYVHIAQVLWENTSSDEADLLLGQRQVAADRMMVRKEQEKRVRENNQEARKKVRMYVRNEADEKEQERTYRRLLGSWMVLL